jgi:hypothetical protein
VANFGLQKEMTLQRCQKRKIRASEIMMYEVEKNINCEKQIRKADTYVSYVETGEKTATALVSCFVSFRSPSLFYLLTVGFEVVYFYLITLRHTPQSVGLLWTRDRPVAETST